MNLTFRRKFLVYVGPSKIRIDKEYLWFEVSVWMALSSNGDVALRIFYKGTKWYYSNDGIVEEYTRDIRDSYYPIIVFDGHDGNSYSWLFRLKRIFYYYFSPRKLRIRNWKEIREEMIKPVEKTLLDNGIYDRSIAERLIDDLLEKTSIKYSEGFSSE